MCAVMKELDQSIKGITNWFLFKTYTDVLSEDGFKNSKYSLIKKKNFFASWQQCNGEKTNLF